MLSCTVWLLQRRLTVQQRHLAFLDIPSPHESVWTQLDNEQHKAVVEVLARLMVQVVVAQANQEEKNND